MSTQWERNVMSGRVCGLRYASLPAVMRLSGIRKRDRCDVFAGVQIMERAAIEELNRGG